MIPGIWLEIEVMGTQCALAKTTDKSWFFQRHGTVVLDRDRYQLDFRNPDVRAYTRSVIDRLIQEYGIGYFKIDYNINAYTGTEYQADSAGDDWMALGLKGGKKNRLAVWHIKGDKICFLPLKEFQGQDLTVTVAFPKADKKCKLVWDKENGALEVNLPEDGMVRILEF